MKLARKIKNPDEIQNFVEESIKSLLGQLYADLNMCENTLKPRVQQQIVSNFVNTVPAENLATPLGRQTDALATPIRRQREAEPHQFFVHGRLVDSNRLLSWMEEICQANARVAVSGNDPSSHPTTGGNGGTWSQPRLRIFGPVGERPLHVCFLRANEFKSKSAEDKSIRQGILNGAKKFIDTDQNTVQEARVPYGKDYCAAVGSRILLDKTRNQPGRGRVDWEYPPPYFVFLVDWVNKTYFCREPKDELSYDSEKLVSTGLYEGETVLYFSIASKDLETVKWLLDHDVK